MNILRDKYLRVVFAITAVLFLFTLIYSFLAFRGIVGPLIIHFDSFNGIDFIGTKIQVFGIMIFGLIMLLINFFLADFIYSRERFLAYVLSFSSLVLGILLLIVIAVIGSVN